VCVIRVSLFIDKVWWLLCVAVVMIENYRTSELIILCYFNQFLKTQTNFHMQIHTKHINNYLLIVTHWLIHRLIVAVDGEQKR
jgi:hypothetical protein